MHFSISGVIIENNDGLTKCPKTDSIIVVLGELAQLGEHLLDV